MYSVLILEEGLEDLRNIVAYIASENPSAAETLGRELLDEAMSLESLPYRGSRVKKRRGLLKASPWELSKFITGSMNRSRLSKS
jgi:plasmid stabilization system protein ParE